MIPTKKLGVTTYAWGVDRERRGGERWAKMRCNQGSD